MSVAKTAKPERLCILTDGIYAIVITLLVLDLKPPETSGISNHQLIEDLIRQLANFKAYIVSFTILAKFWLKHYDIFKFLKRCDGTVMFLNFIHILFISLIPFTSSLVGRYAKDEVAVIPFIVDLCLAGFFLSLLKQYVVRKDDYVEAEARTVWAAEPWYRNYTYTGVTLAALFVSFVNHDAAFAMCFLAPFIASFVSKKYAI
ncbi:MAG: DUF1211 domain-containing protein [Candidatus Omnitrophica bacterium]|nr:DUF1211 domain-containing protein [Candidatus Omnitrophota bacterium]